MFSKEVFKNERKLPDFFAIFVKRGIFYSFFILSNLPFLHEYVIHFSTYL